MANNPNNSYWAMGTLCLVGLLSNNRLFWNSEGGWCCLLALGSSFTAGGQNKTIYS